MPPVPPTPKRFLKLDSQIIPKNDDKKRGSKGRPKGRQQVARTPIRSSRLDPNTLCHFPHKLRKSSKMPPFWVPFSITFGTFLVPFAKKLPKGSRAPPQSVKKLRKCTPRVPKWSPRGPNWCPNGTPGCPNGDPRFPKVQKRHQRLPQSATQTPKYDPKCH